MEVSWSQASATFNMDETGRVQSLEALKAEENSSSLKYEQTGRRRQRAAVVGPPRSLLTYINCNATKRVGCVCDKLKNSTRPFPHPFQHMELSRSISICDECDLSPATAATVC